MEADSTQETTAIKPIIVHKNPRKKKRRGSFEAALADSILEQERDPALRRELAQEASLQADTTNMQAGDKETKKAEVEQKQEKAEQKKEEIEEKIKEETEVKENI